MIYLKTYENEFKKQSREVDLQQLWDDLMKYGGKLFDVPVLLDYHYSNSLIPKLLQDKEVEFASIYYGESPIMGRINNISIIDTGSNWEKDFYNVMKKSSIPATTSKNPIFINVSLYDNGIHQLARIYNWEHKEKCPQVIKIYNSEELPIEKKIRFLKSINRFDL